MHLEAISPGQGEADSLKLLARSRCGDTDAFCELCRIHEARLFRQAVALCGDAALAEDLAQETLVSAWRGIQKFRGQCRFFTWLCSILVHLHCNVRRKKQPVSFGALSAEEGYDAERHLQQAAEPNCGPDRQLQQREREAILRRALERLPEKHRDVVYLRFHVDASLEDIAAALNCSLGTVKSRLFHALEKLAAMPELKQINHHPESL